MVKIARRILPLAVLVGAGCINDNVANGGAGAGNPPFADVVVTIQANSTAAAAAIGKPAAALRVNPDGSLTLSDSTGEAVTLTSIQAWVLDYEFELPVTLVCSDTLPDCIQERLLSNRSFVTDFIPNTPAPTPQVLRIPAGVYGFVGVDLANYGRFPGQDSTAYPDFQNLLLLGHLGPADSAGRTFIIRMAISDSIDFQTPDSVAIQAGVLNQVVLPVNVDGWFRDVDLAHCLDTPGVPVDTAGRVEVRGDTACSGAGLKLRMNVQASGTIDIDD